MHWVLQENLFNEHEWGQLISTLERFDIPFSVHKVVPFIGELIPTVQPKQEKVVCFGSYSMRHTAKANNWNPGVYDLFDQNFNVQLERWGELMLNHDSQVLKFKDVPLLTEPTFMRPIDDSKYFAGKVFMPADFNSWQHKVVVLEDDYGSSLSGETLVQVCAPKIIYAEYRYWIVDGQIVTKSMYKRGDKVYYSSEVDSRFDQFVRECIDDSYWGAWQPHRAFVIDVCDTPDGLKIVEINTMNAAGFYAGDIQSIVLALEAMEA